MSDSDKPSFDKTAQTESKIKTEAIPFMAAILVTLIAGAVLYGWFIKSVAIVQINPAFAPMQFNTALLFFLSGLGLLAGSFKKTHLAVSLGAGVALFAFATLLQYILQKDFHIDQLFMKSFTAVKTSHLGRMSPQSAVNFILTGLCLSLFFKGDSKFDKVRFFLASCILALSLGALLGYVFNIECTYGFGAMTRMALHTSVCFSILSIGIMAIKAKTNRHHWSAAVTFSLGLLISLFVVQVVLNANEKQYKTTFESDARDSILAFKRQVEIVERLLYSVRAFYEGSNSVERGEFTSFVHRAIEGMKSVQAVEWAEKITHDQRAEFENQLLAQGVSPPNLRELSAGIKFITAKERSDYYPVVYTEPYEVNNLAIGFDHGADVRRRRAIESSRDDNETKVTVPLRLFREEDKNARGLLVFEPVYKNGTDISTLELRRQNFAGVLTAVIRVPRFMERALAYVSPKPLEIFIFDVSDPQTAQLVYKSTEDFTDEQLLTFTSENFQTLTESYYQEKVSFAGTEYQVVVMASALYAAGQHTWYPALTFFLMLAGTLGATFFVIHAINRNRDLQSVAAELNQAHITSEASRSHLQAVLDSAMDVSIIATDEQGIIRLFNRGAERMLGWKAEEMIGLNTPRLIHLPEEVEIRGRELSKQLGRTVEGFEVFVALAKEGRSEEREWTYVRKDGTRLTVNLSVTAVYDSQRNLSGFLGIAVDVTERKRMLDDLKKASEVALEASRAKSEFLATMSHEIRTPMNAILGMSELLAETQLTDEQRHFVSTLSRAGETLLALINDVLDLSKIESGIIEIEDVDYPVRDLIERITELLAVAAHRKGLELTGTVSPDMPEFVEGDVSRVRQVLMNLIGNAIKFTEKGEVSVELRKKGSRMMFSVRDTGIGIPRNKLETVFEPFTQADSSTTRKYGGTGLGLSISRKLVCLMGGELKVESEAGKGSRFYFDLPLKPSKAPLEDPKASMDSPPVLAGKNVLVVDDNETNRMILRKAFENWKMNVWEAACGQESVDLIRQVKEEKKEFDLIVMDGHMPDMDGFQTAEKIKQDFSFDAPMIMMLTSDYRGSDMEKAKKSGFETHILKPVRRTELLKVISGIFLKKPAVDKEKTVVENVKSETVKTRKILLAEDAIDNQELMKAYLKKQPYELDIAQNGKIAVEKAASGEYDLILMDMQMPEMDGYAATEKIRASGKKDIRGEKIKIVALTANALEKDAEKCLAAGCDAYLSKPIKKAVLLAALEQHLSGSSPG